MMLAIVVNTVVLSMDRYPITQDETSVLEKINEVMTYVFTFEMVTMIIGQGPSMYASEPFNVFDGVVVILSLAELIIDKVGIEYSGGAVSALRAVRLLRIFRLARKWTSFRVLLRMMYETLYDIQYFAVLLFLFIFIEALLGMELFAYNVKFSDGDQTSVVTKN